MREIIRLLALMLALTGCVAPQVTRVSAVDEPKKGRPVVDWKPCPGEAKVECGTVPVPVDWARPDGPKVALALARRRASEPGARVGVLMFDMGGPSESGVDTVLHSGDYFSTAIRRRFDIVGMDARGVGRSHPVVCSRDVMARRPHFVPGDQADFDRIVAFNRRLREDCRARTGPLFDHVDTLSVARDVDAIRTALGEREISFYGLSYGTLIGQQYAEEFPRRVRAVALDSVIDHSLGVRGLLDSSAATVQDAFEEFVAWCGREASCALRGRNVRALWSDLLARAGRGEIPDPRDPRRPLPAGELIGFATSAFSGPDWPVLAEVMRALDAGEPVPEDPQPQQPEVVPYPSTAIRCADWHLPVPDHAAYTGLLRRAAAIAPDMRYAAAQVFWTSDCLGAPAPVANPQHRPRTRGLTTPMLLVNALHDPVTGHNWASGAARQLGRGGVLLTYDGWGHVAYGRGGCVTGAIDRYLISRTVPAAGTHCPATAPEREPDNGAAGADVRAAASVGAWSRGTTGYSVDR